MKQNELVRGYKTRHHRLKPEGLVFKIPKELRTAQDNPYQFISNQELQRALMTFQQTQKPVPLGELRWTDGSYSLLFLMYGDEELSVFSIYRTNCSLSSFTTIEAQQNTEDSETFYVPTLHFQMTDYSVAELKDYATILMKYNTEWSAAKHTLQNRFRDVVHRLTISSACEAARIQVLKR